MKTQLLARIIAAAMLGLLFGCYFYSKENEYARLGRREFLAKQAFRFDQRIARPHSLGFEVVGFLFLVGGFIGSYELLVIGITKMLWGTSSQDGSAGG